MKECRCTENYIANIVPIRQIFKKYYKNFKIYEINSLSFPSLIPYRIWVCVEKRSAPPQRRIDVSTISRELWRNRTKTGKYNPNTAHKMAMERRERIVRNTALKPGVLEKAIRLLKERRWFPEQISGHLRKKGITISKERIDQHIRQHPELAEYCHHKMKYRRHQKNNTGLPESYLYPTGSQYTTAQRKQMGKDLETGRWTS